MFKASIVDFKNSEISVHHKALSTPSKELRQNRAATKEREGCAKCYRLQEKLSRCARCKTVSYCSKECQKADWPLHKVACTRGDESTLNITKIAQRLLSSTVLSRMAEESCVYACDMTSASLASLFERYENEPFIVRVDVAIEPEDVKAFYKIYNDDDANPQSKLYGLVQINAVTDWTSKGAEIVTEGALEMWRQAKAGLVGTSTPLHDSYQGLLCISKGNALNVFHPIVVSAETVAALRPGGKRSTFGVSSAMTDSRATIPKTLENVVEYMNTHIRQDTKDKLCLRSVLGETDIQTIKDAGAAARALKAAAEEREEEDVNQNEWSEPPIPPVQDSAYAAWIMRKKVDREQVYLREATMQFFASLRLGS
ncbi:hypothetical protein R3P38DRAFT_3146315 [Favolaschia claudopus]|uniref:MYND-type domain-containing protein n=1 Tax=Favolaschia claudopus TaxID=2862362 RepID=A0AAV9Z2R6_9AGAR